MIHPFLLLENINRDKIGISPPFTIVIISLGPFLFLSSSFHNPFPISEQRSEKLDERIMRDYYFGISKKLQ